MPRLGSRDLFFEAAPFAAVLLDKDGHVVVLNPRARQLFERLGARAVVGTSLRELIAVRSQVAWTVALHELGPDGTIDPMMVQLGPDPAGRTHDVLLAATAWPDETGARTAVAATLIDVTDRLGIERDVHSVADRYRSIMETARDAILLLDRDQRIALVNGAARELFGAPGNTLIGRRMVELLDDAEAFLAALAATGREDHAERLSVQCTTLSRARAFPADVSLSRFGTERGPRHTVIIRDETEREALQRALEEKARQLTRKNEELEAFSYSVSHALKAPLRTMGSFAGLLHSRYRDALDATGARYLSFLVETCAEQSRQIEQLLDMSRLSRSEDAFEVIDVEPIVRRVVDYHVLNAGTRRIEVSIAPELPPVVGQRLAFYHLFDNLIGNAVKFTANEAVARISIGYSRDGAEHHFHVSDNGIGIAPDSEATIFRLFGRLHRQDEFEGTGAGLNIVTKILERHGGRVEVESALGEGATFHIYLPERAASEVA